MSVLTKTRRIKKNRTLSTSRKAKSRKLKSRKGSNWRNVAKDVIAKHGEPGMALRGLRYREGLTQEELARKLGRGTSRHHISEMEYGRRDIDESTAKKLAKILHTNYRIFLNS